MQETVRSHTKGEAEGAHEGLVADDNGDGGHNGEAQRPHRPQLELLPSDAHLRCHPPSNRTTKKTKTSRSDHAADTTCREERSHFDQPIAATSAPRKRTGGSEPTARCRGGSRQRGRRIWAASVQWRGDLRRGSVAVRGWDSRWRSLLCESGGGEADEVFYMDGRLVGEIGD